MSKYKTQAKISNKNNKPSTRRLTLLATALGLVAMLGIALSLLDQSESGQQVKAATNVLWSPPQRILNYSGRDVGLAQDPIDHTVSYVAASGGYGIVEGQENQNWLNGDHIKLATDTGELDQYPRSVYDEFSTLYVVWGHRNPVDGHLNIGFNRILRGANNVTVPRNLSAEMFGLNAPGSPQPPYTSSPHIAYSIPQHKVYVSFIFDADPGDGIDRRAYFSESSDQGTTWSKPIELGKMTGYAPATPDIVVDEQGYPHYFFGVMSNDDSRSWIYERVRGGDGIWSQPRDIAGAPRTRMFRPKFTVAPNGDIWGCWPSDPSSGIATYKELTVARWNSSTNQWQSWNKVAGESGIGDTAIAVGDNNQVWVMWSNITGDYTGWKSDFTYTTDNGQSWAKPMLVVFNGGWYMKRSFGMNAIASKGLIYYMLTADTNDPEHAWGDTLFLQQIPQDSRPSPDDPTPTPLITPPTAVPSPTALPATVTPDPNLTASPGATLTPTPTGTATTTPTGSLTPSVSAISTSTPGLTPSATALPATPTTSPATLTPGSTPTPPGGFEVAPTPPAGSGSGPAANNNNQPAAPTTAATAAPTNTATPLPTATALPAAVGSATAYAQAQMSAAAVPFVVPLPTVLGGQQARSDLSGGIGPRLELPTATPTATARPTATLKPTATSRATPSPSPGPTTQTKQVAGGQEDNESLTPSLSPAALTATTQAEDSSAELTANDGTSDSGGSSIQSQPAKKKPSEPGPLWLGIPALTLVGKGLANVLGPLIQSLFKFKKA